MTSIDWRGMLRSGQMSPDVITRLLAQQRRTGRLPVAGMRGPSGVGNVSRGAPRIGGTRRGFAGGKSGIGTLGSPFMGTYQPQSMMPDDPSALPDTSSNPTPSAPPPLPPVAPPPAAPSAPPASPVASLIGKLTGGSSPQEATRMAAQIPPFSEIKLPGQQPHQFTTQGNLPGPVPLTPFGPQDKFWGSGQPDVEREIASIGSGLPASVPTATNPTPPPPPPPSMLVNPAQEPDNRQQEFRQMAEWMRRMHQASGGLIHAFD